MFVNTNTTKSKIAIQPYVDSSRENMGLEKYGQSVFEGGAITEPMFIRTINGVSRAVNGLDEFAPDVQALEPEAKEARIKAIREEIAEIQKQIFGFAPDPTVPKNEKKDTFWQELKIGPDNIDFYNGERFTLWLNNGSRYINLQDPYDRLLYNAVKGGGYSLVASSLETALNNSGRYKYYLDVLETTSASNEESRRIANKAVATLEILRDENLDKLILIARNIDPSPGEYKKSTPTGVLYNKMDGYIKGELWEKNKKKAAKTFYDLSKLTMEELILRSYIKVAMQYHFVEAKSDGYIYYMKEGISLGRNIEEVLVTLKNPKHEDVLKKITDECDKMLNQ